MLCDVTINLSSNHNQRAHTALCLFLFYLSIRLAFVAFNFLFPTSQHLYLLKNLKSHFRRDYFVNFFRVCSWINLLLYDTFGTISKLHFILSRLWFLNSDAYSWLISLERESFNSYDY